MKSKKKLEQETMLYMQISCASCTRFLCKFPNCVSSALVNGEGIMTVKTGC